MPKEPQNNATKNIGLFKLANGAKKGSGSVKSALPRWYYIFFAGFAFYSKLRYQKCFSISNILFLNKILENQNFGIDLIISSLIWLIVRLYWSKLPVAFNLESFLKLVYEFIAKVFYADGKTFFIAPLL